MIKFGVARKYHKNLVPYLKLLKSNSISLYEMGCAFSIPSALPPEVLEYAKREGITLTAHLPFYINFGNVDQIDKSVEYLKRGLILADHLNTLSVFHLGFYSGRNFKDIKPDIIKSFKKVFDTDISGGYLGIETTGKQKAIGTYEEVIELVKELKNYRVLPIIDIAHLYARSNGLFPSKKEDFQKILDDLKELSLPQIYFHAGGIEYAKGNERKHISIKNGEPPLALLIELLEERRIDANIIVESPTSIEDIHWIRENKKEFQTQTIKTLSAFLLDGKERAGWDNNHNPDNPACSGSCCNCLAGD